MAELKWDEICKRVYETGVDHGVLYIPNAQGVYDKGYAWNGLISLTESRTGAEANPQYADNIKYLNLISAEEFGGTIECFTYPDEFAQCDGSVEVEAGIIIGQQARSSFGLAYRTKIGNDLDPDAGYKLHLVYNAMAAPTEKAYTTVNDSPEAITFSYEITTTAVEVGTIGSKTYKPTASLTIDSTKVSAAKLAQLEGVLFGTAGADPRLPLPAEVIGIFSGTIVTVKPTSPTYTPATKTIAIPTQTGTIYQINGKTVSGNVVITKDTVVTARPASGYLFDAVSDDDWFYSFS